MSYVCALKGCWWGTKVGECVICIHGNIYKSIAFRRKREILRLSSWYKPAVAVAGVIPSFIKVSRFCPLNKTLASGYGAYTAKADGVISSPALSHSASPTETRPHHRAPRFLQSLKPARSIKLRHAVWPRFMWFSFWFWYIFTRSERSSSLTA